MFRT
jgi:hypothetical protein